MLLIYRKLVVIMKSIYLIQENVHQIKIVALLDIR